MAKAQALNDKQIRFCEEFLVDLNGTKAYLRAYPDSTPEAAASSASTFLNNPKIWEKISALKEERAQRTNLSQDRVIQELSNVAFGHLGLVCVQGKDGSLTLKQMEEMDEGHIAILHSVKQSEHYDKDGNLLSVKHNFNMHDKLKALELLGKHLGIYDGNGADKNSKSNAKDRLLGAVERVRERLAKRGTKS